MGTIGSIKTHGSTGGGREGVPGPVPDKKVTIPVQVKHCPGEIRQAGHVPDPF